MKTNQSKAKVGRPRNLNSPSELLNLWDAYKKYIQENPDKIQQATVKGDVIEIKVKKPYLKQGFIAFVFRQKGFIIDDYLRGDYEEFSHVVTCIRQEWEHDQIAGTMTGRYKSPNLTARLNGLVEKTDNKHEVSEIIIKRES